ncbi:hypothetical protein SBRCBS47491_009203 [Sporothrix bragantina]|uniref:L-ornithine N(5)-oxygenase n=1 Tax=Sporothrix bragantina TaxID=671064 RepID=A0ABP0CST9_9PEZI
MGSVPKTNGVNGAELKHLANTESFEEITERYKAEHDKRLRTDGLSQFTDLYSLPKFQHFKQDPWADKSTYATLPRAVDGDRREILIMGTGIAALVFAVRLLEAGLKREDLQFIDISAGFGGTWYWNRYPGLMCDVESYIYMPLLEETGYVPKHKYASGTELREHAERIANKYGLSEQAWYRTRMIDSIWDDSSKEWVVRLAEQLADGSETGPITVRSRFVILTTGLMLIPQVPQITGIETFDGDCFHAARWDYQVTGGSQQDPSLVNLKGKKVGIIGTGASSVQIVPELAKWADQLYVFQRTPSAVDRRGNRPTDVDWFTKEVGNEPGWWAKRSQNFCAFVSNSDPKPLVDKVNDGWTSMLSYSALIGNTAHNPTTPEEIQKYYQYIQKLDLERQSRVRDRVDVVVKDPATAAKLKPWYSGFCKRPCFHDEYLDSFNKPNVQLVDTDGKGIDEITKKGLVVNGQHYDVDVLILGTGYKSPFLFSPPGRVGVSIIGRNAADLDKKWTNAVTTLHGIMSHDFPNMFWPGFIQAGGNPNYTYTINQGAIQVAHLMRQGLKSAVTDSSTSSPYRYNFTIEATAKGEDDWSMAVVSHAHMLGASSGCTPSYMNAEGELEGVTDPAKLMKMARSAPWGKGQADFDRVLEEWRKKGDYQGVEIMTVS